MAETNFTSTKLSDTNVTKAKTAITKYVNSCRELNTQLDTAITKLTGEGSGFNGDAADGYLKFYKKVKPAFTKQLVDDEGLMPSLAKILDSIYAALNEGMDPGLGSKNEDAGNNGAVTPQEIDINSAIDVTVE